MIAAHALRHSTKGAMIVAKAYLECGSVLPL
jgi:hypothetical protein